MLHGMRHAAMAQAFAGGARGNPGLSKWGWEGGAFGGSSPRITMPAPTLNDRLTNLRNQTVRDLNERFGAPSPFRGMQGAASMGGGSARPVSAAAGGGGRFAGISGTRPGLGGFSRTSVPRSAKTAITEFGMTSGVLNAVKWGGLGVGVAGAFGSYNSMRDGRYARAAAGAGLAYGGLYAFSNPQKVANWAQQQTANLMQRAGVKKIEMGAVQNWGRSILNRVRL